MPIQTRNRVYLPPPPPQPDLNLLNQGLNMEEVIIREEPFGEHVEIEDKVEPTLADEDQHTLQRVYPRIKALERFSGAIDQNARDHLYDFETVCDVYRVKEALRAELFPITLVDDASFWFRALPRQTKLDADLLTAAFLDKFDHVKSDWALRQDLLARKQGPKESVQAYAAVIRRHCYRLKQTDAYMLERFVFGLREPMLSYVTDKQPQTFDEAVKVANTSESLANFRASRNVTVSNIRPPILQTGNTNVDFLRDALTAITDRLQSLESSLDTRRQGPRPDTRHYTRSADGDRQCSYCHKKGHVRLDCRQRLRNADKICDYCGELGHIRAHCPIRLRHMEHRVPDRGRNRDRDAGLGRRYDDHYDRQRGTDRFSPRAPSPNSWPTRPASRDYYDRWDGPRYHNEGRNSRGRSPEYWQSDCDRYGRTPPDQRQYGLHDREFYSRPDRDRYQRPTSPGAPRSSDRDYARPRYASPEWRPDNRASVPESRSTSSDHRDRGPRRHDYDDVPTPPQSPSTGRRVHFQKNAQSPPNGAQL